MDKKELKANQKFEKVISKVNEAEDKLFALKEKKRQMAVNIHNKFHEQEMVLKAGN